MIRIWRLTRWHSHPLRKNQHTQSTAQQHRESLQSGTDFQVTHSWLFIGDYCRINQLQKMRGPQKVLASQDSTEMQPLEGVLVHPNNNGSSWKGSTQNHLQSAPGRCSTGAEHNVVFIEPKESWSAALREVNGQLWVNLDYWLWQMSQKQRMIWVWSYFIVFQNSKGMFQRDE